MRKITYYEAISEAIQQEMERDNTVICFGIGVPDHKEIFGSTKNLQKQFGRERVFDTPLSEDSLTGLAIGAAMNGFKPILIHIRADFVLLAMNQLINIASGIKYITNGQLKCSLVIRVIIGRGWGQGFQHSKSLFSLFTHIPGLTVIAPSNPCDAKGMLIKAIRSAEPVICFEHRWLYWQEQEVEAKLYETSFTHEMVRDGGDRRILLISYSWGVIESLHASDIIKEKHNINIDVLDLKVLSEFNFDSISKILYSYKNCLIIEDDWLGNSVGAGFIAKFCNLPINFFRIGWQNIPCPTARHLENDFYYNEKDIVKNIEFHLGLISADLSDIECFSHTNKFKGPF